MSDDSIRTYDSRDLVAVAMGRKPADIVVRDGIWVCVQSGELIPGTDVAIHAGRIAFVGPDASHAVGGETRVIEAGGRYLVPGLLDGHMHIESGMVTVTEFVRAVLPHGTTGMFVDPHEIANVFGLKGVRLMVDEAAVQPIHVWVEMPSCVPSAPGLETSGAAIGPEEVMEAMTWPQIVGLGEMMNFPGVFNGDERLHGEIRATRLAGKVVGGHYASPDLRLPFHGYVAGGPEDDHEGTRLEDAVARVRQGMKPMLRLGSAWFDVAAGSKAVTELGLDPRHFILCTDDSHSETLVHEGHMDRVVRHAISCGLEPIHAIQMATLNTAEHFGLSRDVGMIAPGRFADLLLVPDLAEFKVDLVLAKGRVAADGGRLKIDLPAYSYPEWSRNSVRLGKALTGSDFVVPASSQVAMRVNVIGVIENQAPTRHLKVSVEPVGGEIVADPGRDLAKIALIERHRGTGEISLGMVHGFGFTRPCAVGTTIAHDSHHLIVVGTDDEDMALAANKLSESGGGQIVVSGGEVLGLVELPIAGLMSDRRAEEVAAATSELLEGFRACGCELNNPNMQLSLLALVVIPEIRISDQGLVDATRFSLIPLVEPEGEV
ncbi:MAG TPA: adenine deaminase [Anaerolineales bacterium]|nr:adenine deaminase [Anaerolineales bacterium]